MSLRIPTTAEAVAATVAVGRRLGLPVEDPVVIAEGYSVRVRLAPAPVVSRVVTVGRILRGEPTPWQRREVAVVQFLSALGAPVVAAWQEPGPFVANGLAVSLWTWVEPRSGVVSAVEFAALLRDLHLSLAGYAADLPLLVGPLTDIGSALERSDDAVLHRAARALIPIALTWRDHDICQPLHGDAHTGNVLLTSGGPRWTDFEDVCVGPIEWDLASTTVTDEAVTAYGEVDVERLRIARALRRLQILAGVLTDDLQDKTLYEQLMVALEPWC